MSAIALSYAELVGVDEDMDLFWKLVCGLVEPEYLEAVLTSLHTVFRQQHPYHSELDMRQWEWLAVRCIAEAAQSSTDNLSSAMRLKVEEASAAVLPDTMDLSSTKATTFDAQVLSISLSHSTHVKTVALKWCGWLNAEHYKALGSGLAHIKEVSMQGSISLHGGGLQALADSLRQCSTTQLVELNMQDCTLDENDCSAIDALLCGVLSLRRLWLGWNYLHTQDISKLQGSLMKSKLELLDLQKNELDSQAGGVLGKVVGGSQHLREMIVSDIALRNDGVRDLLTEVQHSCSLQFLDLSCTGVNDHVLDAVSACLLLRSTPQQTALGGSKPKHRLVIRLHGNAISSSGLGEVACHAPDGCQDYVECDSVTMKGQAIVGLDYGEFFEDYVRQDNRGDLVMVQQGIGDSGAEQIARHLRNDCSVHTLDLGLNSICDAGAAALGTALQVNTTLRGISLHLNRVGCTGAISMATSLASSYKTLTVLNLHGNPLFSNSTNAEMLRSEGEAVRRLVGASSGLRFLDLGNTGFGDAECKAIGETLTLSECRLSFLCLGWNSISDKGVSSLCSGVEHNDFIQYVDLSTNINMGNNGFETIRRCVASRSRQGSSLKRVWLGGNSIDGETLTDCMVNGSFAPPTPPDMYAKLIKMYL